MYFVVSLNLGKKLVSDMLSKSIRSEIPEVLEALHISSKEWPRISKDLFSWNHSPNWFGISVDPLVAA